MDEVRADYEHQLDARFAAARGFVDEVLLPEELAPRRSPALARVAMHNPGPHVGPFQLRDGA
jgi:3-methylcrotonyl-CoA carboxylase beta subunit